MNVAIIGRGKFGQALGSLLTYNGIEFEYAEVNKLLTRPADVVFLMVPAQAIRVALTDNLPYITSKTAIVNGAKGIEENTHLLPHQIVDSIGNFPHYYCLIGPSFAHGIKAHHPTLVSLGYVDEHYLTTIIDLLTTPYFRLQPVPGFRGLELAGALKNLYAILCGYSHGIGLGANTQALLINLALKEFAQLATAMGFVNLNMLSPGVVGDLVLTCSSEQSRNFKFGVCLAKARQGAPLQIVAETVEGFHASHSITAIAQGCGVELPLAALTCQMIEKRADGTADFHAFIDQL